MASERLELDIPGSRRRWRHRRPRRGAGAGPPRLSRQGAGAISAARRDRRRHPARPECLRRLRRARRRRDRRARRAVYTDEMVMHDAIDESRVGRIADRRGVPPALRQPLRGDPPRRRAPVAARRRAGHRPHRGRDRHARCSASSRTRTASSVFDANGRRTPRRRADRLRRRQVGGAPAVRRRRGARLRPRGLPRGGRRASDFPADLQWNAPAVWVGPNCHLVHYPLRGGEQYNVVVTFHSREAEEWSVREGSREEVQCVLRRHLRRAAPADRPAEGLEALGHRRPRPDRPVERSAASRCSATRRTRCCSTSRRAPAWRWKTRSRSARRCACTTTTSPRLRALPALARRAHRARRAVGARDGPHLPRQGRRAPGAQRPVERAHARTLLRRDGMAVRLARRQLPRRLRYPQPFRIPHEATFSNPKRKWSCPSPAATRCTRCAASIASAATTPRMHARWVSTPIASRRSSSASPTTRSSSCRPAAPSTSATRAQTSDYQHEIELVVAIGKAGRDIPVARANEHVLRLRGRARHDAPRPAD